MNASASMGKNGDVDFALLCNGVYSPCKPDFGEKRILFSPGANIEQVSLSHRPQATGHRGGGDLL